MQKQAEKGEAQRPREGVIFVVPVAPVSYKLGKDLWGNLHLTTRSRNFQEAIQAIASAHRGFYAHRPQEVAVTIAVNVRYRPTSFRMPGFLGKYRQQVPDCTNIQKAVEDALKKIFFDDDIQVARIHTERIRVERPEDEKIVINVRRYPCPEV